MCFTYNYVYTVHRKCRSQSSLDDPHTSAFSLLAASADSRSGRCLSFYTFKQLEKVETQLNLYVGGIKK